MSGLTPYSGLVAGNLGIVLYQGIVGPGGIVDTGSGNQYTPGTANLLLTGFAPIFRAPYVPLTGNLFLTGQQGTISIETTKIPTAGSLILTGAIPEVTVPVTTTTFSVALSMSELTLSNGDLTAVGNMPGAGLAASAETIGSASSGKFYCEFTYDVAGGAFNDGIGIILTSFDLAGQSSYSSGGSSGYGLRGTSGVCWGNGIPQSSNGPSYAQGDILGMAVDLTGGNMWFRNAAGWSTGDPGTGTSPAISSIPAGTYAALVTCYNGSPVAQWTANFGASAFTYSVPSGYTTWPA